MKSLERNSRKQYLILYFQVHQPRRLNAVKFFDLPNEPPYFNDALNESIARRVARNCYIPANRMLLELIREFPQIRITFSLSGVVLEQMQRFAPEVIDSFRALAETGSVEFLSETYYHSLASLVSGEEFEEQVLLHAAKINELFGLRPTVFRNTALIYNDQIGERVARMGFQGIFTEGHENMIGKGSPHELYCHPRERHLKIFLRNYRLSDDIAFRFMEGGNRLDIRKYMSWIEGMPASEKLINLAMDYETFGEHHKEETGIFDFLRDFLKTIASDDRYAMVLPTEATGMLEAETPLSSESYISWAGIERDLSAWLGNDMQKDAFNCLMKLEKDVKGIRNERLLEYWRYLQTSDHLYYMSLKTDTDGTVHSYFSPFPSSYEAFINFMNVVTHLTYRIQSQKNNPVHDQHDLAPREAERQDVKTSTPVWVMNLESVPQGNVPKTKD